MKKELAAPAWDDSIPGLKDKRAGTSRAPNWGLWLICLILAGLTLAAYWPVAHCDFVEIDDFDYVKANPHVLTGLTWENVLWAFRTGHSSNWHPVTWLSLMLDVELFGSGPEALHLVNLLFHGVNGILLFAFLKRATGALWRSAAVAGLFALHPLHVESVAWIAERKDVLSTCFALLTLLAYGEYARRKRFEKSEGRSADGRRESAGAWYCLAVALFAMGLMSKPMLVTLPLLMLLLDYWPLGRFEGCPRDGIWSRAMTLGGERSRFFFWHWLRAWSHLWRNRGVAR